ncbi:TIGR04255 family protein [Lyngbya sp. CCY1209]|uniref:TIGR04255 family protein n=1 Tax=Lyngbya sp. CCY1209 TaxID=2886103 RepID=UPI002D20C732|nr:TIGR04255 family protein [Lyngbya sp. CCY1209]MEB3884640.1 TIGR04255 family protein [Lyngbya sp. CCY1209]
MKLPNYERVIYKRNPLVEVVCQIRFPTILKISNQEPAEFQDKVRFQYPLYEVKKSVSIPGSQNEIFQLAQKMGLSLNFQDVTYCLRSEDLKWQVLLNKDFIALATTQYERYESFKARLKEILEIFDQIYEPSFYSRIDLKYQDLIIRSNLDLDQQTTWADLIPEHIASELHTPEIAESLKLLIKNLEIDFEGGKLQFKHGLVMAQDPDQGKREPGYLLDADFFVEQRTRREDVWNVLDQFKESAGKLFRWSITDKLHEALEPERIHSEI